MNRESKANYTFPIQKTMNAKAKPNVKDLGFGKYFTDHMFIAEYENNKGWFSPRIEPYGPISLDPAAMVFHYGMALFEGMKAFHTKKEEILLFRPEFHCKRMAVGAERLCMPPPDVAMLLEAVKALVRLDRDWIPQEKGSSLYLRPTLIAKEPKLGVKPASEYILYVILSPVGSYYAEGMNPVKIWVEDEHVRAAQGGVGYVKTGGNYAASLYAAQRAQKRGYTQVLWLDAIEKKYVEEVGTMNIFFKIGNEIITPPLAGTILGGSTRDAVIQLLKSWGLPLVERPISIDEVMSTYETGQLKEVFGTGTAAVISPVGELFYKGKTLKINDFKIGELSQRLYDQITGIQYGEIEDSFAWTSRI